MPLIHHLRGIPDPMAFVAPEEVVAIWLVENRAHPSAQRAQEIMLATAKMHPLADDVYSEGLFLRLAQKVAS